MTKAEKNYKRDYGHKDSEELALNYTRDGMREELDKALSEVSPDDLSEGEKEYLDGRHQCRDHTLNIRFNDTEWERICRQADALHVKKSSYVRECTKAHYVLMFDKDDMNELMKQIRGIATNINQVAYRANSTGNIYGNDIADMKVRLDDIWQSLQYIRSGVQLAQLSDTSLTAIRPEIIHLSSLLYARENQTEQQSSSERSESLSEQDEAPPLHST